MFEIQVTAVLHIILVLVFGLRVIARRLAVPTTLAWIIVIAAFPIIGLLFYFVFGDHRLGRKRIKLGPNIRNHFQDAYKINADVHKSLELKVSPYFRELSQIITAETGFLPSFGNRSVLISTPDGFFNALLQDIELAKNHCYLEFYIIEPYGKVCEVLEALCRTAERGVDCRIIADDIGSKDFFKSHWPQTLRQAGVIVVRSLPVGLLKSFSKRTDLRNHRKIIVIDQKIGYIGSFNLIDPDFFKRESRVGQWIDLVVRVEGHAVSSLACVFNTDYIFDHVGFDFQHSDLHDLPQDTKSKQYKRDAIFQILPSGPEMRSSLIYEVIVSAIFGARKKITIVTPYFVPDEAIVLALSNAAKRGLIVELILPHRVDSRMARYAGQANFSTLLEAGVQIYRFVGGMLHTKAILIDDSISFVGTVNMDMRSFYLNLEITLCAYDKEFAKALAAQMNEYLEKSRLINADIWAKRKPMEKWKERILRLAGPLL